MILDLVRSHPLERGADLSAVGEAEAEVEERLWRCRFLPGVQREVEAVRVADDDRAIGVPLCGGGVEAEVRRIEAEAAGRVAHWQAEMVQVHGLSHQPSTPAAG